MTRPDPRPLIVCFGDSLTAGFQSPTLEHPTGQDTPYGAFLRRRLDGLARIAISGVCGERTDEMVRRFRRDVVALAPAWVVILGGTNDLGWNVSPEGVMRNLTVMYETAAAHGVRPVAVTVPSIRAGGGPADAPPAPTRAVGGPADTPPAPTRAAGGPTTDAPPTPTDTWPPEAKQWVAGHIARREALNGLIRDYCHRRGIACLDLFTETAEPGGLMLAAPYSNDGLHLTTNGYERFAALLYERVFAPALTRGARPPVGPA